MMLQMILYVVFAIHQYVLQKMAMYIHVLDGGAVLLYRRFRGQYI